MDFGALPPEVNSARMYAGPGPGPMLAAAHAWEQLAAELQAAAVSYGSVVADLTGRSWTGPAATSMAAAAAPYLNWLTATAAGAGQAAGQAAAAATAFEAAFASTVPPAVIAANRSLLASLVATNLLGQNTPAIAAAEAHYAQMWAQDAAVMYGYAAASSAATNVTPFSAAPQTTGPAGAELQPVIAATPQALQGLSSPAGLTLASSGSSEASSGSALSSLSSINSLMMPARMAMMPMSMLMRMLMMGGSNGATKAATGLAATTTGAGTTGSTLTGAAAASMGGARTVGALSVPAAWSGVGPAITTAPAAFPATGAAAAPAAGAGAAAMPPMMPVTALAGRGGIGGSAAQYDFRPTVLVRSPIGG